MNRQDIDSRFRKLTHPGPGHNPDLHEIERFLMSESVGEVVLVLSYLAAGRVTRRVEYQEDVAQSAALTAIMRFQRQVTQGQHLQPRPPLKSLTKYLGKMVSSAAQEQRRVQVPHHVKAMGSHATWLFQKVIVANQPLAESLDELVANHPREEDAIRGEPAEAIRDLLRRPHELPGYTLREHFTSGVPDVEALIPGGTRSVTGPRMVAPEDAALALLTREAIKNAVDRIEDDHLRSYARAWFVERTVQSVAELEERFDIRNGKYVLRKIKDLLAVQLHHLKPST